MNQHKAQVALAAARLRVAEEICKGLDEAEERAHMRNGGEFAQAALLIARFELFRVKARLG